MQPLLSGGASPRPGSSEQLQPLLVHCPLGHVMRGQVVQEIWHRVDFVQRAAHCGRCGEGITSQDACYNCEVCKYDCCTVCAADMISSARFPEQLAENRNGSRGLVLPIMAGDILLCGPDRWGIHHVVLVCSPARHDPMAAEILGTDTDQDIFSCMTIESSHEIQGRHIPWYAGRSFYARNRVTGIARHVGDMETGTRTIHPVVDSSPVKVLLHPLRPGHGGPPFIAKIFRDATQKCALVSKNWGLNTALSAFTSRQQTTLTVDRYPDVDSRRALLDELRERWTRPPICSSVAIMVWQKYFLLACGCEDDLFTSASDVAVQLILQWIPAFSHQTMPSMLVKILTGSGWILRGGLDF